MVSLHTMYGTLTQQKAYNQIIE